MSDLIERTAVLDLMRTNWADNDGDTAMQLSIDDVRNMPAASADEMPAVDAIKRESVLNTLDAMDAALDENRTVEAYKELLKECYKALPPVTPKQRMGKWILVRNKLGAIIDRICSCCNGSHEKTSDFCPHCGAKMGEE